MGCGGPKMVGEDSPQAKFSGTSYASDDPSHLRYPYSNRAIDHKLYILNHPEHMQLRQQYHNDYIKRLTSKDVPINDYTNLQPREVSPFRQ